MVYSLRSSSRSPCHFAPLQTIHERHDQLRYLDRIFLHCEVAGIQQVELGIRHVPQVCASARRNKDRIVLAPHDKRRWLRFSQELLPARVRIQIRLIVLEKLHLDQAVLWRLQTGDVVCPRVRAHAHAPVARHVA